MCDIASDDEEEVEETPNNTDLEMEVYREIQRYKMYVLSQRKSLANEVKNKTWDLANWWKHHAVQFKYLSETVKAILCTPASSTNCERCFSTCTLLITKQRNRLSPDTVEKVTFLKDNFKYYPKIPKY